MSSIGPIVEFDEQRIDAIFSELDQSHLPGAAVGIAIDGKPVYRKGFGMAHAELPVALSPTIRMRIGSTTKHFASLAYLLLCESGKAKIDDSIGTYVPELHPVSRKVTMRQLMGHISGLCDAFDLCWQFSGTGRPVSSGQLLSLYSLIDHVNAAPGTHWIYNNGGYLLLSVAIERISGQCLEDVLRETIFEPVGMYDTMLRRFDTDFVSNSATLHSPIAGGGFEKTYMGTALAGEGGMVSTINDMLIWLRHMDAPEVGTPATWKIMRTPQTLANGTSTGYGLGLMTDQYRGVETLRHSGGVLAGSSDMIKVVRAGLDVVIMANRGDVWSATLANRIIDACIPSLGPIEEPFHRQLVMGTFRSATTNRVIQLAARNGQQIASINGVDMPISPDRNGVLRPSAIYSDMKQTIAPVDGTERPGSILFDDLGNQDELGAVLPNPSAGAMAIEGQFRSESAGVEVTIFATYEGIRMNSVGRFGSVEYRLECLIDGVWRASALNSIWGGLLSFYDRNDAFSFSSLRTWDLRFLRVT